MAEATRISSFTLEVLFQTSAFESLKSKGTDIISDDSIRLAISNLYDISYPKMVQSFDNYNVHLTNEWRPFLIDNYKPVLAGDISSTEFNLQRVPINLDKLRLDFKAQSIICLNQVVAKNCMRRTREIIEDVKDLKARIDKFLRS